MYLNIFQGNVTFFKHIVIIPFFRTKLLYYFIFFLFGLFLPSILFSHAVALMATTSRVIEGNNPRLSSTLESIINNEYDFELFGINYRSHEYFSISDIAQALSSIDALGTPIESLNIRPAYKVPAMPTEATDPDGDYFAVGAINESSLNAVTLTWYRNNAGTEVPLTPSELAQSFCELSLINIRPYFRITGPIVLNTRYGIPRTQHYPDPSIGVTKIPVRTVPLDVMGLNPTVCYIAPSMTYATGKHAGPKNQWHPTRGFINQSTHPATYNKNFPTTGADNLHFTLFIANIDATTLTWDPVTVNGITATPSNITTNSVRVTLNGPKPSAAQDSSNTPTPMTALFTNPTVIEITGKDNLGATKISYGFSLSSWFISRSTYFNPSIQDTWCHEIGNGGVNYRTITVRDVTNAIETSFYPHVGTSPGNYIQRRIGDGLLPEWGNLADYSHSISSDFWTSEQATTAGNPIISVDSLAEGALSNYMSSSYPHYALCRSVP